MLWHYRNLIKVRRENPEIARGAYTALSFPDTKAGGFLCEWNGSVAGVFHNTTEGKKVLDLTKATDHPFTEVCAVLEAIPDEGGATLEDGILTLYSQTSVVLK